jgi:hypothetical protein
MRWLERYMSESSPRLQHFAEITTSLARRELRAVASIGGPSFQHRIDHTSRRD